jgi:hypothetical protein
VDAREKRGHDDSHLRNIKARLGLAGVTAGSA